MWIKSLDRNDVTYFIGLVMLFVGLCLTASVAAALVGCGAVLILTSIASSFFVTWLSTKEHKQ